MLKKQIVSIFLIPLFAWALLSCNIVTPTPVLTHVEVTETAIVATPSMTSLPPTPTTTPGDERIVFYYFVPLTVAVPPQGSVVVLPDAYILAPQLSESAYSPDTAADLRTALELALNDPRNGWTSTNLDIVDVAFHAGHTDIVLQGEYFGVGDVTLIAAKMQMLMTVFANPEVQTARITLNGDTIGNLGVSNIMYAYPDDYVFTQAEIEVYQTEHLYVSP